MKALSIAKHISISDHPIRKTVFLVVGIMLCFIEKAASMAGSAADAVQSWAWRSVDLLDAWSADDNSDVL